MTTGHFKGSKESPAPLDAYLTLKPGEPHITLQGGDPLSIPTLQYYIKLRRDAGIQLEDGPVRDAELLRCTELEKVLWTMHSYQAGQSYEDEAEEEDAVETIEAVDLFDARRQAAGKISQMFSELSDICDQLEERGYDNKLPIIEEIKRLRTLFNQVEPRPGRHITP